MKMNEFCTRKQKETNKNQSASTLDSLCRPCFRSEISHILAFVCFHFKKELIGCGIELNELLKTLVCVLTEQIMMLPVWCLSRKCQRLGLLLKKHLRKSPKQINKSYGIC